METRRYTCSRLVQDWAHLTSSPGGRAAFARWAAREPALARYTSAAEILDACQQRDRTERSNELLGALLRLAADDDLAARTVLLAVLPALVALARSWAAGGPGSGHDPARLEDDVVASAWEVIAGLAGRSPAYPAAAIRSGCRQRLRWSATLERRRSHDAPLEAALDRPDPGPGGAEQLAGELVWAVREGRLTRAQASVVYSTRVLGHPASELAARLGRDARAVRAMRARAERVLAEAG